MSLDFMKDDGVFMPMLNDTSRNIFYETAIKLAAPGKVVCDIGTGTGFLSIIAAQAGAKHVIAVEQNAERYQYAKSIFEKLGLNDRIELILGDFLDLDIKADVYVSETINTQIFGEDIIKLSNHAQKYGGKFIPGQFKIHAKVFKDHPIFVIDQSWAEINEYNPGIDVNPDFTNIVNNDFIEQYGLGKTRHAANQLNRLFTMLPRFSDLKLTKLYETDPITVDLNQLNNESDISIVVPYQEIKRFRDMCVVLFWQAEYNTVTMNSNDVWFGNVNKQIAQANQDIVFRYDPQIHNWRLTY
jgi:SAM-dependent methyltransferase